MNSSLSEILTAINSADAILVGAGSGLSTSAGFTYSGSRFEKYFSDFSKKYGFKDMYTGGFWDFESLEEHWAYWSRYIYINRYTNPPIPVYDELYRLVKNRNYFVLTTNVDHCFQKAGFDKSRLFYTQGDYGLWQCSVPCHKATYDNELFVTKMVEAQQNERKSEKKGDFDNIKFFQFSKMTVPSELIPKCPECGKPMTMNLRADDTFVEDEGWYKARDRYEDFLAQNKNGNIVFLELGVGGNTPGIIKYPFWNMTYENSKARYICINKGEAVVPAEIKKQSICINDDIFGVLCSLR